MKLKSPTALPSLKKLNSFFFLVAECYSWILDTEWFVFAIISLIVPLLLVFRLSLIFPHKSLGMNILVWWCYLLGNCYKTDVWEWNDLSKGKHIQNLRGTVNCPLTSLYNSDLDISIWRWACPSPAPNTCLTYQTATLDIKNHLFFCQSNRWKKCISLF